jgi:hypothetical protein
VTSCQVHLVCVLCVRSSFVGRLIELYGQATRHLDVNRGPVADIRYLVDKINATALQLGDGFVDVVAIEGHIVRSRALTVYLSGWMAFHIGFWYVEDEPTAAYVRAGEVKLVSNEGSEFFHVGRVEQRQPCLCRPDRRPLLRAC